MSANETYNGYPNRETWAVALYIDNDEGIQDEVLGSLRTTGHDVYAAETIIRECIESLVTVDGYTSVFGGDTLPAALSRIAEDIGSLYRVDWNHLAKNYTEQISEDES